MSLPIILMIIGIVTLLISIYEGTKQSSQDEIEQISISLHQETNYLKKRVKALEEELMMDSTPVIQHPASQNQEKPVHTIIVSQITALHGQGYSIEEISKRSTLPPEQVLSVLRSKGVRV
ncbi:hypothetical protein [Sporosarcina aquimarina]|uniref:Resolvase HTH domain-containing protein n=1 Tax=Sporosarcina aquimarina TaxID=114975 RepID=A0ABU4FW60_9BACL|nr:hypothetical protein [Sporosarcina aquimarina]MDW0108948.1 hypothetical protein [Sporosarcina aquimarina]